MALILADRVKETTTTTGTGTITLGGAVTGYQSFSAVGNGNTTYYTIAGQNTSEWEVGIGTYTSSGTTLSRTTVLASSNAGALVTFSSGTKDVFVTYPAGYSVVSSNNSGTTGQVLTSSGTGVAPTWSSLAAGGSTTQVQYNSSGVLAGSANMTFSGTALTLANDASINGVTVGKGLASNATNTAFGVSAVSANTTGNGLVGVGYRALLSNTTGTLNVAVGSDALRSNINGSSNIAIGQSALVSNIDGGSNIAIGNTALQNNTTNLAIAAIAGGQITGGSAYTNGTYTAVALSYSSGSTASTYGTATVVVSSGAVTSVTIVTGGTGYKDTTTVLTVSNTLLGGTGSGFSFTLIAGNLTRGINNIAVGTIALGANTVGTNNTAVGANALSTTTTGSFNQAIGTTALQFVTTGSQNIGIGFNAGGNGTSTVSNTILMGNRTGQSIVSGSNSVAIGNGAAVTLTTGSNNIYLGASSNASAAAATNEIAIGYNQTGLGNNTTVIGNSSTTGNYTYGQKYQSQPAITALTATATLTIAQMLTDIITVTSATAVTLTLPTGTLTDAGIIGGTLPVRGSFDWSIINLGSALGAVTIANGTDHTFVGGTVAISTSSMFRTVKTATNTYITYLIS